MDKRLTIDLRGGCDLSKNHILKRYKPLVYAYYGVMVLVLGLIAFQATMLVIAKNETNVIEGETSSLSAKIQEVHVSEESLKEHINKVNTIVSWQQHQLHVQKLLYSLFSKLPKEVLIEKFDFKMSGHDAQASIIMDLKGSQFVLNEEFEKVPEQLMEVGLRLISFDQVEIKGGLQLKCLCQVNGEKGGAA